MNNEPKDVRESVIRKLHQVANPDPFEVGEDELDLYLAEHGADLDLFKAKLDSCLAQASKKSRLLKAKQLLAETRESLESLSKTTARSLSEIKAEIEHRLGNLRDTDSGLVKAYFQKYEDLKDEDLPDLLLELEMLDELAD